MLPEISGNILNPHKKENGDSVFWRYRLIAYPHYKQEDNHE